MRCMEAAWLLQRLSQSGSTAPLSLVDAEREMLDGLVSRGLVEVAPDVAKQRAELVLLREKMRAIVARRATAAARSPEGETLRAEEGALRTHILELSEKVAHGDGAVLVHASGAGGPYREGAGTAIAPYRLTYQGRALVSDLAPRLSRVGGLQLDDAKRELELLRNAFAHRAGKAAAIAQALAPSLPASPTLALRAAALGLAARNEPVPELVAAFLRAFDSLRSTTASAPLTPGARELAAECICLAGPTVAARESAGRDFVSFRDEIHRGWSRGDAEDSFDAAVVLVAMDPSKREAVLAECRKLATDYNAMLPGRYLPLALALLMVVSGAGDGPAAAPRLSALETTLRERGTHERVALGVAVVLSLVPGDAATAIDRFVACRDFLSRFSSESSGLEPALLSTLAIDVPEIIDDVRLAASEIQRYRLATGGAEAMSLGIKLLLEVAVLAAGNEGDPEEALKLAPYAVERLPGLGLSILSTTLPVALNAVAAFHLPAAGASWIAEQAHPAHSSVIFGTGGGRSWG